MHAEVWDVPRGSRVTPGRRQRRSAIRGLFRKHWVAQVIVAAIVILALSPGKDWGQAVGNGRDLAGTWEGTLGQGALRLRIVLTIGKESDGTYKGSLNSVDQGAVLPVTKITLKGVRGSL